MISSGRNSYYIFPLFYIALTIVIIACGDNRTIRA